MIYLNLLFYIFLRIVNSKKRSSKLFILQEKSQRFDEEVSQRQELIPTKANCHSQRFASSQSEQIQWLRKDVRDGLQAVKVG